MDESLYDETVDTKRMTKAEDSNKKTLVANLSDLACHIQPDDSNITQDISVGFGKNLLMFCSVSDIIEGDRVYRTIDEVVYEYRVVSVESFNNAFGISSHMEVRIRAFKS